MSVLKSPIRNLNTRKSLTENIIIICDVICKEGDGDAVPIPLKLKARIQFTDLEFNPIDNQENHTYTYNWGDASNLVHLISSLTVENPHCNITLICTDLDVLLYSENNECRLGIGQFYRVMDFYDLKLNNFSNKKMKFYEYKKSYIPENAVVYVQLNPVRILLTDLGNYFDLSLVHESATSSVMTDCTLTDYFENTDLESELKINSVMDAILETFKLTCSHIITPVSMSDAAFKLFAEKYVMPEIIRDKFPNLSSLILTHKVPRMLEFEKDASHGARTEVYYHGKYPEKIYQIDVNNLYGYIMRESVVPIELVNSQFTPATEGIPTEEQIRNVLVDIGHPRDSDLTKLMELPKTYNCVIVELYLNIPPDKTISPVAVNPAKVGKSFDSSTNKPRIIFPTGIFKATVTTEMFKYLVSEGYVIGIKKHSIYSGFNILKFIVDDMHELRYSTFENGEPNKFKRKLAKLIINLISGKFAQRKFETKQLQESAFNYKEGTSILMENGMERRIIRIGNKVYETNKHESYSSKAFPAIYAHITDNARLFMYLEMKKIGFENVLYIDNDGLIINQNGYDKIKNEINQNTLGKFKLEHEGYVDIKGNKTYTIYAGENHTGEILKDVKVTIPKGKEIDMDGYVVYSTLSIDDENKLSVSKHSVQMDYTKISNREQNGTSLTDSFNIFYLEEN